MTNIIQPSVAEANALYKAADYSGRATPSDTLIGAFNEGLISVARLIDYDNCYLVRHVCTLPEYRGKGTGSELCQAIITLTEKPLYLFPRPELVAFYIATGFTLCPEDELPRSLAAIWKQVKKKHPQSQPMRASENG